MKDKRQQFSSLINQIHRVDKRRVDNIKRLGRSGVNGNVTHGNVGKGEDVSAATTHYFEVEEAYRRDRMATIESLQDRINFSFQPIPPSSRSGRNKSIQSSRQNSRQSVRLPSQEHISHVVNLELLSYPFFFV